MDERKAILLNEIRYAERLTQRTARLYRRIAWACTFLGVLGGSGVLSALAPKIPASLSVAGAILLAVVGAIALTVRPFEKAISNDTDAKKYAALRTTAVPMNATELEAALNKARETDTAEIEPLRDVAYNDMLMEVGRPDMLIALKPHQQLLSALA